MKPIKHYGDITQMKGTDVPIVNIVTGGSPCQDLSNAGLRAGLAGERSGLFMDQVRVIKEMREHDKEINGHAGKDVNPRYMVWENVCFSEDTLITCESGYKKISEIGIGEKVKTLSGRYMPVVATHKNTNKEVITIKYCGGENLVVTPNHPVWAREKVYSNNNRTFEKPKWIPAGELTKHHLVAHVIDTPTLPDDFISHAEAWALGRWLADGSVDLKRSNPRIFISCGLKKAESTLAELQKLPYQIYTNHPHPTAINYCFTSRDFYSLIKDCGIGASNKRVPSWVFELPFTLQKSVLDGYISGDGYIRIRGKGTELSASTASRELAYGICRLIRNVYHVNANISINIPNNVFIDGRKLNVNHVSYTITASLTSKVAMGIYEDGIMWSPVKKIVNNGIKTTVYNLSVLEDNTYAANDIAVHNCGAFSSNGGEDFRCVLEETIKIAQGDAIVPQLPPKTKWTPSGYIMGDGWSLAWRIHDAQYWGVPQRRKRICVLADFGGDSAPYILFDPQYGGEAEYAKAFGTVTDSGTES